MCERGALGERGGGGETNEASSQDLGLDSPIRVTAKDLSSERWGFVLFFFSLQFPANYP